MLWNSVTRGGPAGSSLSLQASSVYHIMGVRVLSEITHRMIRNRTEMCYAQKWSVTKQSNPFPWPHTYSRVSTDHAVINNHAKEHATNSTKRGLSTCCVRHRAKYVTRMTSLRCHQSPVKVSSLWAAAALQLYDRGNWDTLSHVLRFQWLSCRIKDEMNINTLCFIFFLHKMHKCMLRKVTWQCLRGKEPNPRTHIKRHKVYLYVEIKGRRWSMQYEDECLAHRKH